MAPSWFRVALAAVALSTSAHRASAGPVTGHAVQARGSSWTDFECTDDVRPNLFLDPHGGWSALKADDAWRDVVRNWRDVDRPNGLSFTASVAQTLKAPISPDCSSLGNFRNCLDFLECGDGGFNSSSSGPAGVLIWNSLVSIKRMHVAFFNSLESASLASKTLAPFWPDHSDLDKVSCASCAPDLVTIGLPMTLGASFKASLGHSTAYDVSNTTLALLGPSQALVQDVLIQTDDYSGAPIFTFSMRQGLASESTIAWSRVILRALQTIFGGGDDSLERLGSIIADGKVVLSNPSDDRDALKVNYEKSYYSLFIPRVWRQSGAFVLDAGSSCDQARTESLSSHLDNDTMEATGTCYEGRQYYLVQPRGSSKKARLSAPSGLDWLNGHLYQGITRRDFVMGSVRTYAANGRKNGGSIDLTSTETLRGLIDVDYMAPGLLRLPVCGLDEALNAWRSSTPDANPSYPCGAP